LVFELSLEDGEFLVHLARNVVKEYLSTGRTLKASTEAPEKLFQNCGAFVTINYLENGTKKLRGCIGYPYPTRPLIEAVIDSAVNAATRDPRFYPLSLSELSKVVFEVSVLTPPEIVAVGKPKEYLVKIKVGEDGLIVDKNGCRGLLLPQVPIEWDWCEEEFLCQCCIKAGLPPDSWLIKDTKVFKFQAIVFEEESPQGDIRRVHLKESEG
jgi:uncharacterized protein (TIGR00296 family)